MNRAAGAPTTVVAIPVHNEAERLAACLDALDDQVGAQVDHVVLLLNNCTDGSVAVARQATLRPGTRLHCVERTLTPQNANAGHARRLAMQAAAMLAGPAGILLTTDADAWVDPDWLASNLAAIAAGADVVAGWVDLDPIEWGQIPSQLHEDDARECAYDRLCDEIDAALDPDPADPLPRHTQHSGASIAVTVRAYDQVDGIPDMQTGEDRAFFAALRRAGARIRHAPEVHVVVSGRIEGRSAGGMADTIRRRIQRPDEYIDDRLEPARDCARRAFYRGWLRTACSIPEQRAALLKRLQLRDLEDWLQTLDFEDAWDCVEPLVIPARVPVRVSDLAAQTRQALAILAAARQGRYDPDGQFDSPNSVSAGLA